MRVEFGTQKINNRVLFFVRAPKKLFCRKCKKEISGEGYYLVEKNRFYCHKCSAFALVGANFGQSRELHMRKFSVVPDFFQQTEYEVIEYDEKEESER